MSQRLGRIIVRSRWWVVAAWALIAVIGGTVGGTIFDRAQTVDTLGPAAESIVAKQWADQLKPGGPVVVAVAMDVPSNDAALRSSVLQIDAELKQFRGVIEVIDQYEHPSGQTGPDNRGTMVQVVLDGDLTDAQLDTVEDHVVSRLRAIQAPRVLIGGDHVAQRAFNEQAIADSARGESIALPILLLVLIVVAGGLVAGLVPIAVAVAAITGALLALVGLTHVTVVSDFAVNVVTLLGIGLSVDYGLLMVARFREERSTGRTVEDAVAATIATAGRAVAISGLAVAAAMGGLYAFAMPLLAAMALGGAIVVLLATAVALTLVPALLAVAARWIPGDKTVTWLSKLTRRVVRTPRTGRRTLLARLATLAQRRPVATAVTVTLGLLVLALPALGANLANSDVRALPQSMEARQAYEVAHFGYEHGLAEPISVVTAATQTSPELLAYINVLHRNPRVFRVDVRPGVPVGATILDVIPVGDTEGTDARALVRQIRDIQAPFRVAVGGPAAELVDGQESLLRRLPLAVLVLLVATVVLLFLLTGSLVVPFKALVANLLTLGATLGILVVLFQWGWGGWLLGFQPWGGIDLTTPVLIFVFVFGLTMDYEVFLLSRIREEWKRSGDNDRAVLAGITRSGRVVTSAALCIGVVFLGFVLGEITAVKEIGVGMTVAVALDVTVVRGLLLPAIMKLLGDANWWAPPFLRRLRPAGQTMSATRQDSLGAAYTEEHRYIVPVDQRR